MAFSSLYRIARQISLKIQRTSVTIALSSFCIPLFLLSCSNSPSVSDLSQTSLPISHINSSNKIPTTESTSTISSVTVKDIYEKDPSDYCILNDGESVQTGWSGTDNGSNSCNQCKCTESGLACTKMACFIEPINRTDSDKTPVKVNTTKTFFADGPPKIIGRTPNTPLPLFNNLRIAASIQLLELDCKGKPESVVLRNEGTLKQKMNGWTLEDKSSKHVYQFDPNFILLPKESLKILSGIQGVNDKSAKIWKNQNVWNNDGDTATLRNKKGEVISQKSCN